MVVNRKGNSSAIGFVQVAEQFAVCHIDRENDSSIFVNGIRCFFNCQKGILKLLNGVKNNDKNYDSVYDWIYNETSKYGKKNGTKYKGCYRLVDYSWDNSIDKDFYKQ